MQGFKSFGNAAVTIAGVELAHRMVTSSARERELVQALLDANVECRRRSG
jgi:hypothetical protein